jgi:hypothetical protein
MRAFRIGIVWWLIVGLSTPAFADDLRESATKAAVHAAEQAAQAPAGPMPKTYLWTGTALFVGGMAAGLYGFLNNENGSFPEFGEAEATDKTLGTVGLVTAFAGGTVLFLGSRRASRSPSLKFGPGRVTVAKTVRW